MATCDLSIDLDDPDRTYAAGDMISGHVRVAVDTNVRCKSLEVTSVWRTHGRGNIATETVGSASLFSGEWQAGQELSYRFELPIGHWPPTYHGHYLSVDHYIDVRAKIPWGFDPKDSVPFHVQSRGEIDAQSMVESANEMKGLVGFILGFISLGFVFAFLVGMFFAGPFALVFLLFPFIGILFWFVRKFLPRWLLGEVLATLDQDTVSPGQATSGELTIRPKKSVTINGISLLFQSREEVVSGSGSNRTTHKNTIFEETSLLQDSTRLDAGVLHRFPIRLQLPDDAPFSLELSDNKLIWSATLRVDIPRWPDWVQEIPIRVVPGKGMPQGSEDATRPMVASTPNMSRASVSEPARGDWATTESDVGDVTFAETASHLWTHRESREEIALLVDAVAGLRFPLEAIVERRLLYAGDDDPHVYKDGYAIWARFPDPPLPLVLYIPHDSADEFEQLGRDRWKGQGTIVGWDGVHGRLQVKIEPR